MSQTPPSAATLASADEPSRLLDGGTVRVPISLADLAMDRALSTALFAHSPFSTVIYDAGGHPLLVNEAFERLWGVALDSVPPAYSVLTDPELERQGVLPVIRRAFQGETVVTPPVRYDISHVALDRAGQTVWTQGYFFPVLDDAGRLTHVILKHVDLSELRKSEDAVRLQEERFRVAQRAAHIGTFDWHMSSGRVAVTEEEERILGLAPGSFDGTIEGWGRYILREDVERLSRDLDEHTRGRRRDMELFFRIAPPGGGGVRWIQGSAEIQYDAEGTPLRVVGVNVDVTERVRAEEERRRSEALLRETERIARIGSWEWDVDGGTLTWSDELYRVYGLDPAAEAITFGRFLELIHPGDRDLVLGTVERALRDGEPFSFDHRIVRADGAVRYMHGLGRVDVDASRRIRRLRGSGQDITERKEAEEALRRAKEEAEAANRSKSDFLAVMSHELRTPLNAIGGYAELIELGIRGPVTDAQREDLRRIRHSQMHLLGLINEVLNYARVEAGAVTYQMEEQPIGPVLAAAESVVLPQARARDLALTIEPGPPGLTLWADREKLHQILLNLLSNAIKFTRPGGHVGIRTEPLGASVAVHVRDTGVGIAADKLQSVFEPFVQVGRALNNPTDGAGLGLAISRDLARGMGGDLVVRSRPGEGSTFSLLLPAAPRS